MNVNVRDDNSTGSGDGSRLLPTFSDELHRLFHHIPTGYGRKGILVLLLMLLAGLLELLTIGAAVPVLTILAGGYVLKNTLIGSEMHRLGLPESSYMPVMAGVFCTVILAAAAVRILLTWYNQRYIFSLGHDLGVALYTTVLHRPYRFHVEHNTSEILSGVTKVQQAVHVVLLPLMQSLTSAVIAIGLITALLMVNTGIVLASAVFLGGMYAFVAAATRKTLARNGRTIAQAGTARFRTVQEGLGGIRDVIIDQAQPIYIRKFSDDGVRLRDAQSISALISACPRFIIEAFGIIVITALAFMLSQERGGLSAAIPTIGALALGAQRLLPLFQSIYAGISQVMGNRASLSDVLAMLEAPSRSSNTLAEQQILSFNNAIVIRNLAFQFSETGPLVLSGVDLHIPKGARLGIVGQTGSGKSTLMDLLMGLISPTFGAIEIDGVKLDERTVSAWQRNIAHVSQHIFLSDATIIENLAFGVPRAAIDEARARHAAVRACIADFINDLPGGYDTIVGERGIRLSGGQRQRIGIARALYKSATMLVMDEATSALDEATEAAVMDEIAQLQGLTMLIIAHRPSALRLCNAIYRMGDTQAPYQKGD